MHTQGTIMVMCINTVETCHNMSKHIKTGQNMSKPVKIGGLLCVSKVAEAPFLYHAVKQLARPKTRSSSSPQMALIAARGTEGLPLSKCQRTRMIGKLRSQRKPMSRRLKRLKLKGKCQKQEMMSQLEMKQT